MENSETKLYSHLHLPRHNLPKSLIEFCPYWVQSFAFFQIQYLLVMNFLRRILSIDEQSFLYLPSSPIPFSIQENSPILINRMYFVLSSVCINSWVVILFLISLWCCLLCWQKCWPISPMYLTPHFLQGTEYITSLHSTQSTFCFNLQRFKYIVSCFLGTRPIWSFLNFLCKPSENPFTYGTCRTSKKSFWSVSYTHLTLPTKRIV